MNKFFLFSDPLGDMIQRFADFRWDQISLSGPVMASLMIMVLVIVLSIIVGIQAKHQDPLKPSKGLLLLTETFVDWIQNWARSVMGRDPREFPGYFLGLFTYLFLAFIWSITGLPSVVDYLLVPFTLSLVMFVLIQATAIKYQKWHYFHRYIEPFKVWLPINLITVWTPIISTSLRMFGNALAGSVVIGLVNWATKSLSLAIFGFMGEAGQIFVGPLLIGVLNLYFSLFSGYIQTLVFASLNAVWIGQEMPEDNPMGVVRQVTRSEE